MAVDQHSKLVKPLSESSENLTAWERWQLPNMDADVVPKSHAMTEKMASGKRHSAEAVVDEEEIRPIRAEDLEAIRQAAFEEGFAEGKAAGQEAGHEEGFKAGEADLKASLTRLSQVTRALLDPIPAQDEALEKSILQLVEMICKRVVHCELKLESSGLIQVIKEAIESLHPGAQRLKVHLNQLDLELIEQGLKSLGDWEDHWRIQAHPTITPGGCIIETDNSVVDARAERRLALMIQQVYEKQKPEDSTMKKRGQVDQLIDEVESFDFNPDDICTDLDIENLDGRKPKT